MDIGQVILTLAPALFGLIGTLVGASLTFQSQRAERRFRQDDEARASLLKVSSHCAEPKERTTQISMLDSHQGAAPRPPIA